MSKNDQNYDGAFKGDREGVGVVVRDHEGDVLASMAYNLLGMVYATQVEMQAIWQAIQLAQELFIPSYIF